MFLVDLSQATACEYKAQDAGTKELVSATAWLVQGAALFTVLEGCARYLARSSRQLLTPDEAATLAVRLLTICGSCTSEASAPSALMHTVMVSGGEGQTQRAKLLSMLCSLLKLTGSSTMHGTSEGLVHCIDIVVDAAQVLGWLLNPAGPYTPYAPSSAALQGEAIGEDGVPSATGALAVRSISSGGDEVGSDGDGNSSSNSGDGHSRSSEGGGSALPEQTQLSTCGLHAADLVATSLPWLVFLGRCCFHWSDRLGQLDTVNLHQEVATADGVEDVQQLLTPLDYCIAAANDLCTDLKVWLGALGSAQRVVAAGYNLTPIEEQLIVLSDAREALEAAVVGLKDSTDEAAMVARGAVVDFAQALRLFGLAASTVPVPDYCNNPGCVNVGGASEAALVLGKGCMCGGCRVAHYCSRACQRQHWKLHKPACQALAAAKAATAPAAATATEC